MNRLYADDRLIDEVPEYDDYVWTNTNCRNCGAPLTRGETKCPYCDTSRQLKSEIILTSDSIIFRNN